MSGALGPCGDRQPPGPGAAAVSTMPGTTSVPPKWFLAEKSVMLQTKWKLWLNHIWLLCLFLDCWKWHLDIKTVACDAELLPFPGWGLCLSEGWETRTWPASRWETIWDEASLLVYVSFWIKSLLCNLLLENRGAFHVLKEISLNGSGCLIQSFWVALCFIRVF